MMEVKSDAVKSNIVLKPGMLGCCESRQIASDQTGDGKSEHGQFRNQRTEMDWNG